MDKLKPCPWCGSAAVVISHKLGLTPQWYVRCPNHDKADEVRKETAKEILQELYDITFERKDPYGDSDEAKEVIDRAEILHTAKMYGVEVEE